MKFTELLELMTESAEILDRHNYPFPYGDLKIDQHIGDLFGGAKIRAVYKLLSPSTATELPNKGGPGAVVYRLRAERLDHKPSANDISSFEGGTHKENFVLLTPEQAQQCIKELHKIEAKKEPQMGINHADMTGKSKYGKESGL